MRQCIRPTGHDWEYLHELGSASPVERICAHCGASEPLVLPPRGTVRGMTARQRKVEAELEPSPMDRVLVESTVADLRDLLDELSDDNPNSP